MTRLDVTKTYKLSIGGCLVRSESGRTAPVRSPDNSVFAHVSLASRKDLRDAVEAARKGYGTWSVATPYNRGQVLYRLAEMMEGKRGELAGAIAVVTGDLPSARAETESAIDRVVCYAGWADKYAQVLGSVNPVAGPYHNFTTPEPVGVVAVVSPASLLGLISLALPALCAGNAVISITPPESVAALVLCEAVATSDLPAGAFNILSGLHEELLPHVASHRGIDAVHAANLSREEGATLLEGAAENLKRVTVRDSVDFASDDCNGLSWIEPLVEFKTVWHPMGS